MRNTNEKHVNDTHRMATRSTFLNLTTILQTQRKNRK